MQDQSKWQELIPFYVARTLSPTDLRAFEARLAGDERLRREVEEWRLIAGAVWREADSVARSVPPLAPEIIAKARQLRPLGAVASVPDYAAPLPENTQRQRAVRLAPASSVPVTLVAGLILAFICGGLLVMFAVNNLREQPQPLNIAQMGTGTAEEGGFAAADATGTSAAISALLTRDPGILPSPTYTVTITAQPPPVATLTPVPFLSTMVTQGVPTNDISALLVEDCVVLNSSGLPINIYRIADRSATVVGQIPNGESRSSIVRSVNNWFMMFTPEEGIIGWVAFEDVSVTPACSALPIATQIAEATVVAPPVSLTLVPVGEVAIVSASFVDLRAQPVINAEVYQTAGKDTRFTVLGYGVNAAQEKWVLTLTFDSREAWMPFEAVQIVTVPPPTTTPTITPSGS